MGKRGKIAIQILVSLFIVLFQFQSFAQDVSPVMLWGFGEIYNRTTIEAKSGIANTLDGNF